MYRSDLESYFKSPKDYSAIDDSVFGVVGFNILIMSEFMGQQVCAALDSFAEVYLPGFTVTLSEAVVK